MSWSSKHSEDAIPFAWPTDEDPELLSLSRAKIKAGDSQLADKVKYGVFLWWTERTPSWVHPDDALIAAELIPGNRVFRKVACDNSSDRELGYSEFQYGRETFRGQPVIWLEIFSEGFELGDLVEIKSGMGKLRPGIATIDAIVFNRQSRRIEYFLRCNHRRIDRPFTADEFQPAIRLESHLNARTLKLAGKMRLT